MIIFEKIGKISTKIMFNDTGIKELINVLLEVLNSGESLTRISGDRVLKIYKNEEVSTMNINHDNSIAIKLDSDELEYCY